MFGLHVTTIISLPYMKLAFRGRYTLHTEYWDLWSRVTTPSILYTRTVHTDAHRNTLLYASLMSQYSNSPEVPYIDRLSPRVPRFSLHDALVLKDLAMPHAETQAYNGTPTPCSAHHTRAHHTRTNIALLSPSSFDRLGFACVSIYVARKCHRPPGFLGGNGVHGWRAQSHIARLPTLHQALCIHALHLQLGARSIDNLHQSLSGRQPEFPLQHGTDIPERHVSSVTSYRQCLGHWDGGRRIDDDDTLARNGYRRGSAWSARRQRTLGQVWREAR